MSKNIFVRVVLLLCIFMQAMVAMPHHHHDHSKSACINIFHVISDAEDADCHGVSCGDHGVGAGHDPHSPVTACLNKHIVTIQPQRQEVEVEVSVSDVMPDGVVSSCDHASVCGICSVVEMALMVSRSQPPKESVWTQYSSRAIPARAPSYLA